MPSLAPLLHARSVAVVGISQLPRFGGRVYQNLRNFGYAGEIFGVNPRYTALHDQPCYPSLRDLPRCPDLAILAVPNHRLLAAMQDAASIGVPAVVTSSSAYSEAGGRRADAPGANGRGGAGARHGDVRPELHGLHLVSASGSWPPATRCSPAARRRQSPSSRTAAPPSTLCGRNRRGLRFNYLVSSGNEIVTTLADYIQHALADPETRVVGLFLETVRDPETFRAALAEAAERDVPVVALKVGRSRAGAQLAQAHSGALAGEDAVYDALFAHYGVQRVRSLDEMLDTLELFAARPAPAHPLHHLHPRLGRPARPAGRPGRGRGRRIRPH